MNLLNYTKKLYEKINFYDRYVKTSNFDEKNYNPFSIKEPLNITVTWTENE